MGRSRGNSEFEFGLPLLWGIVQWQYKRLLTVESRFESWFLSLGDQIVIKNIYHTLGRNIAGSRRNLSNCINSNGIIFYYAWGSISNFSVCYEMRQYGSVFFCISHCPWHICYRARPVAWCSNNNYWTICTGDGWNSISKAKVNMESVDPFDRWLDPPDPPDHGECDSCGFEFRNDDLEKDIDGRWLCYECLNEAIEFRYNDRNDEEQEW